MAHAVDARAPADAYSSDEDTATQAANELRHGLQHAQLGLDANADVLAQLEPQLDSMSHALAQLESSMERHASSMQQLEAQLEEMRRVRAADAWIFATPTLLVMLRWLDEWAAAQPGGAGVGRRVLWRKLGVDRAAMTWMAGLDISGWRRYGYDVRAMPPADVARLRAAPAEAYEHDLEAQAHATALVEGFLRAFGPGSA